MKVLDRFEPVYYIDEEINNLIDSINTKLNNIKINDNQRRKFMINKSKVRSIHSSLSIEANSLSLSAVENISENKQVSGKKMKYKKLEMPLMFIIIFMILIIKVKVIL